MISLLKVPWRWNKSNRHIKGRYDLRSFVAYREMSPFGRIDNARGAILTHSTLRPTSVALLYAMVWAFPVQYYVQPGHEGLGNWLMARFRPCALTRWLERLGGSSAGEAGWRWHCFRHVPHSDLLDTTHFAWDRRTASTDSTD